MILCKLHFILCVQCFVVLCLCAHKYTYLLHSYNPTQSLTNADNRAGLFPGQCHFYALFYFGYSEISTAILTLLANFDPEVGVIGLEKIFPKTKIVLGTLFVTSFIIFRVIMWPFTTYYFARDVLKAIRSGLPQVDGRKGTLYLLLVCCACLSVIQFVFVAMIIQIGKQEIPLMIESLFPKTS